MNKYIAMFTDRDGNEYILMLQDGISKEKFLSSKN